MAGKQNEKCIERVWPSIPWHPCILYADLRPFLMQSDSASRKRPFSFFDWILMVLFIVSRVDFIVFVLFFFFHPSADGEK